MTIKERLIAALEARGWTHDAQARTRRYYVMRPPTGRGDEARFFIGPSGALRYSTNGNVTSAYSAERSKNKLLGAK